MTESIMSLQQFLRRLALGRRWVGDHEVSDSAANRHAFWDVGGADLGHEDGLAQSSSPSLCFDSVSVSKPVRLVQQRSSDDGGGVGATRVQRRRQHDVRGPAAAAADPARAHRHCRCPVRAHRAGATVAPGEQPTTAATRAAQRPGGQVPLGQLGGAGDDHDDRHGSRHTSLAYHTRPHQRPIGVGHTRSRPAAVTDDDDHGVAVTIHTATSCLPSSISEPEFRGQNDAGDEPAHTFASS